MQPLGSPLHLAGSGQLIIRCQRLPVVPCRIYDSRHRPVGELVELFGPWQQPLGRVNLDRRKEATRLVGQQVFAED